MTVKIVAPEPGDVLYDVLGNRVKTLALPFLSYGRYMIPVRYLDGPFEGIPASLKFNEIDWVRGIEKPVHKKLSSPFQGEVAHSAGGVF